jgi:hypothetical protein
VTTCPKRCSHPNLLEASLRRGERGGAPMELSWLQLPSPRRRFAHSAASPQAKPKNCMGDGGRREAPASAGWEVHGGVRRAQNACVHWPGCRVCQGGGGGGGGVPGQTPGAPGSLGSFIWEHPGRADGGGLFSPTKSILKSALTNLSTASIFLSSERCSTRGNSATLPQDPPLSPSKTPPHSNGAKAETARTPGTPIRHSKAVQE